MPCKRSGTWATVQVCERWQDSRLLPTAALQMMQWIGRAQSQKMASPCDLIAKASCKELMIKQEKHYEGNSKPSNVRYILKKYMTLRRYSCLLTKWRRRGSWQCNDHLEHVNVERSRKGAQENFEAEKAGRRNSKQDSKKLGKDEALKSSVKRNYDVRLQGLACSPATSGIKF